jgi:hypothetical protein
MLLVGQGLPADQLHDAFRHLRQQIEQHDRFVEMIEIVGCEPGLRIDVGGGKARGIERRARRFFVREQGDRSCHRAAQFLRRFVVRIFGGEPDCAPPQKALAVLPGMVKSALRNKAIRCAARRTGLARQWIRAG